MLQRRATQVTVKGRTPQLERPEGSANEREEHSRGAALAQALRAGESEGQASVQTARAEGGVGSEWRVGRRHGTCGLVLSS